MLYNYIMPRHFYKLWNSPKQYADSRESRAEQKIEDLFQSIKFKLWHIFKK